MKISVDYCIYFYWWWNISKTQYLTKGVSMMKIKKQPL